MSRQIKALLSGVTAVGAGQGISVEARVVARAFQAIVTGTGAVTATVAIEVSNDGVNWTPDFTLSLSGTGSNSKVQGSSVPYAYVRGNVTAITGTGATVNLTMAI